MNDAVDNPPADNLPPADPPADAPADPPAAPPADPPANPFEGFPENWRSAFAGDDEKELKRLERFNDLGAFAESVRNQHVALSKRDEGKPPLEDAGDEAWAEWRKANNIPTDGVYEFSPDVLGEDGQFNEFEKPYIEKITAALYQHNIPTDVANDIAKGMKEAQADQVRTLTELDSAHQAALSEAQKQGWGPDAQANKNLVEMMIEKQPEAVREVLKQARGVDGKLLINDFGFMNMMANAARVMMPGGMVAATAAVTGKSNEDELKEIQKMRKENYDEWHKPQFAEYRARERELIDAIDEVKAAS